MQIDPISSLKDRELGSAEAFMAAFYVFFSTVLFLLGLNTCHNKCVPFISLYGQRINQAKYSSFTAPLSYFLNNEVA